MLHTLFITLHAAAGVVAFAAGAVALRRGALFGTYLWSLVGMALFLALAIATEWYVLDVGARVLFSGFVVLAGYMLWRAVQARAVRPSGHSGPSFRYVEHIGFTLIALLAGFVVVTVLNLGAPIWLVVASGVLIGLAGHLALRTARSRMAPPGQGRTAS